MGIVSLHIVALVLNCAIFKSMFYIKNFQKPINDAFRDVRLYTLTLQFDSALFDVYICRFQGCLIAPCNITIGICSLNIPVFFTSINLHTPSSRTWLAWHMPHMGMKLP